jgi:hypothetical protein
MKKRMMAILLAGVMMFSAGAVLSGCGQEEDNTEASILPFDVTQPIQNDGEVFLITPERLVDKVNAELTLFKTQMGPLEEKEKNVYEFNMSGALDNVMFSCTTDKKGNVKAFTIGGKQGNNVHPFALYGDLFTILYGEPRPGETDIAHQIQLAVLEQFGEEKVDGSIINVNYQGIRYRRMVSGKTILYTVTPTKEEDRTWQE